MLNPSYPHCFAMSADLMEEEGGCSISHKSGAHILPTSEEKLVMMWQIIAALLGQCFTNNQNILFGETEVNIAEG